MAETTSKTRLCVDCNTGFEGASRTKRCDPCRNEQRKATARAATAAWRARQPKQDLPIINCEDCGTHVERASGGRQTKKFCDPCLAERARMNSRRSYEKRRAENPPVKMARACLDCSADITGAHARTVRCNPCGNNYRRKRMREYLREWKRAQPKQVFRCKSCDVVLDREGKPGVGFYCDTCRPAAKRQTQKRAEANARKRRGTTAATHCHYCGIKFDRPRQRGRTPARCDECKRQVLYAYKRSLTDATRPRETPCRDCGDQISLKRKGRTSVRCVPCAKKARQAVWLKYAQIYRHLRRAWKYAVGYEKFSSKEIYERDGWRCGICRKAISRKLRHPNPMSVSLDHKISLSRGGSHSRRNTQPAHLRCNVRKNKYDALPGEQMPLPIEF